MIVLVTANSIRINCEMSGRENGPWLIFSNSLATDLSMWSEQADRFAGIYRILRHDQRGHGRTDAPEGRYSFDTLLADVIGLMDALAIERATFCGLSMGGATALGLAQKHASRFDRIVVCDSPCASNAASAQQWEERIAAARAHGMDAMAEPTMSRWFPPETLRSGAPFLAKVRRMIRATPLNGFIGCAAALADHDFRKNAASVKIPALLLAGEKDGAVPASMRQLQSEMPASRYVELTGAGHISNMDNPDAFNSALLEFLSA
jgi:3-oxoadipate enol-lactonase